MLRRVLYINNNICIIIYMKISMMYMYADGPGMNPLRSMPIRYIVSH